MAVQKLYLQCLLGMQCNDFTMIAADQTDAEGIIVMKDDEDKLVPLSENVIMGMNGEAGDRAQLSQFILKNLELYKMRNGYQLSAAAVSHFTRKNMEDALHNGTPYIINLLMGGYDPVQGGLLYTMDFLATCVRVPFAAHGVAGMLSFSILSNYYRPDLSEAQAYDVMKMCVSEIGNRLFMSLSSFTVKSVSKDGIKIQPLINSAACRGGSNRLAYYSA